MGKASDGGKGHAAFRLTARDNVKISPIETRNATRQDGPGHGSGEMRRSESDLAETAPWRSFRRSCRSFSPLSG